MGDRECLGAGTARLFAGFVRPDAVLAEADRAALGLLGDAVTCKYVPLLRGVGPVLIINTVVVVAAAQRRLVRRPVGGCRYYLGRSLATKLGCTSVGGGSGCLLPNIGSIINYRRRERASIIAIVVCSSTAVALQAEELAEHPLAS